MWIIEITGLRDGFCGKKEGNRTCLQADKVVIFCVWCCFFVRRLASGVRMPPARAGLFRSGHFQGEAVASRL
ncbi:hypothetical protein DTV46_23165 [Salmonella enterica subsp. salamae]|nr:hypothetical protein CHD15_25070 [Salmonella enterica]EAB9751904.1 hypothetical protein [Salmonella enterica subsp. salamae]EBX0575024.1 hypothetical protein [Salmonella enterica subsp. enterica serovar Utah]EDI0785051.1 hypothetical protein [Salmonella enterica subsp. enterica serovar Kasenyi]EDS4118765.1 hypothetical protein [Salmonella enterica subsp. enterica serovar Braenderup]